MEVRLTKPDGEVFEESFTGGYRVYDLGSWGAHVIEYRAKHGVTIGEKSFLGLTIRGDFSGVPLYDGDEFVFKRKGYILEVTKIEDTKTA